MNEKTASERLEQLFGFKNEDGLSEAFLSVLEECIRDADEEVRAQAASLLALVPADRAEEMLLRGLADESELVRTEASDAAECSCSPLVLKRLKELSRTDTAMIRGYAARSFAKSALSCGEGLDEAVSFLEESLRLEEDQWVALFFLQALCLLGRYDCYPPLLLGIDSGESRNRCAALHGIEEVMRPQDRETTIVKIKERLRVEDDEAVRSAIDILLSHLEENGTGTADV
ncbi:HEAT repeat domain-containing protein [Solibaculum intestinale]|uniref:HEAT repeat domain-containing protein n=1 Tax=Solibaculum intestinale TaxID=3133165 RepID=A0ABV1DWV2_9FIRM